MSESSAYVAVETAARESYSRLIAYLAIRAGGDLTAAEDAMSDAILAALQQWPHDGIPTRPTLGYSKSRAASSLIPIVVRIPGGN